MIVSLTFSSVDNRSKGNTMMPTMAGYSEVTQFPTVDTASASGVAQLSAADWTAPEDGFIEATAIGAAAWLRVYDAADSPTPAAGAASYCPADATMFRSIRKGQKFKAAAAA